MEAPVFGRRAEGSAETESEPVPFQIAGYCLRGNCEEHPEGGGEHLFAFKARGSVPMGSMLDLSGSLSGEGGIQVVYLMKYLYNAVLSEDRNRLSETLDRSDVEFEGEMLMEIVDYLNATWTGRPLRSRSARRAGQRASARGHGGRFISAQATG